MQRRTISEINQRALHGLLSKAERRRLACDERAGVQRVLAQLKAREQRAAQEAARLQHMLQFETLHWKQGATCVAGVDEVGAGPLAGPVIAAAVVLPPYTSVLNIDDSKKLTAAQRDVLAKSIKNIALSYAVAGCSSQEIDTLNILQAGRQAMARAVRALDVSVQHLLVDARYVPETAVAQTAIIRGDSRSQSIAAASIIAKVERDALMTQLAAKYPQYGFAKNRGYGTAEHLRALRMYGPCAIHRRSFAPVAKALSRRAATLRSNDTQS